eukprot:3635247-Rhodomonas_salina.1
MDGLLSRRERKFVHIDVDNHMVSVALDGLLAPKLPWEVCPVDPRCSLIAPVALDGLCVFPPTRNFGADMEGVVFGPLWWRLGCSGAFGDPSSANDGANPPDGAMLPAKTKA